MRATPPAARMSAGTRSSAITATAPASSAIRACSAVVTSMMTPPLSISASPRLTRNAARPGRKDERADHPRGPGQRLMPEGIALLVETLRRRWPDRDPLLETSATGTGGRAISTPGEPDRDAPQNERARGDDDRHPDGRPEQTPGPAIPHGRES